MGKKFRKSRKDLFIVLSPYFAGMKDIIKLDTMAKYATGMPIMTYDYALSAQRSEGPSNPNSPISWIQQVLSVYQQSIPSKYHGKLLLGLNWLST